MECVKCHRTGFTQEELRSHQLKVCEPLGGRDLLYHLKFDSEGPNETPCAAGMKMPSEDAGALASRVAELERVIQVMQASAQQAPAETEGA